MQKRPVTIGGKTKSKDLKWRYSWILCLLALTLSSNAQTPLVSLGGIAHVAFRVSDIDKTRLFYKKLGFEEAFSFGKDGNTSQSFIKINDEQFIELYPSTPEDERTGFMHVCFASDDLLSLNDEYRKRGLTPSTIAKGGAGNLLFALSGPEGQNIEYTQYMPGSLHFADRSKHLGPFRISNHILGVAIKMHDVKAAESFYMDKLSFILQSIEPAHSVFALPGSSREEVAFTSQSHSSVFDITFEVASLPRTVEELKTRGFIVSVNRMGAFIKDPNGINLGFTSKSVYSK